MGDEEVRDGTPGVRAALLAAVPVAIAAALLSSSRTLVSWHGFAHVGIAERIANGSLPPENPFFAGEPLPAAWLHEALAAGLARLLSVDALHAFALLTLAGLALLTVTAQRLGARHFGSAGAGLLIAWLALAGVNPAGPAIAALKAVHQGIPLLEFVPEPVETVFVSDESAELFMAHPLLGALHLSSDWRQGQNLPWFLDNSSRGPALALLLPLLGLVLAPPGRRRLAGAFALGAITAALDPLVGLAAAGALLAGACGAGAARAIAFAFERGFVIHIVAERHGPPPATGASVAAAALAGALLAAHAHLPQLAGSALPAAGAFAAKAAAMAASFCVLAPLAVFGALRAPSRLRPKLLALALGGLVLVAAVPALSLARGDEAAFGNAAALLLAVPALGFVASRGLSPLVATALLALFLPVTLCTLMSFAGRPPLPIAGERGVLVRTPGDDPLAQLYAWIRRETPPDAVFVVDAGHPVKMASRVSELPAFTGRALFVDQPSDLTAPHAGLEARMRLAAALAAGEPLREGGARALLALGRAVYLVSHAGDDPHLAEQLTRHYGAPLFASGFVAVYPLAAASPGERLARGRASLAGSRAEAR